MKIPAMIVVMGVAVAASAAAQGTSSSKAASPGASSKGQLSEVRSLVHELTGHTEKLRDLLNQYASLVEQRPQDGEQQQKWQAALERLLKRIDVSHASVVDAKQRLEQLATGELPTGLAKDVARARNEADAERANAEQVLAKNKNKASQGRKSKPSKPPAEKAPPPLPDDLDL